MSLWVIIIGIILFAVVTAILYAWGINKSINQRNNLSEILYNKCANKVISHIKKNNYVTFKEICDIINNVKASEFYSKNKAVINNSHTYAKGLVSKMCEHNLIKKSTYNKTQVYIIDVSK